MAGTVSDRGDIAAAFDKMVRRFDLRSFEAHQSGFEDDVVALAQRNTLRLLLAAAEHLMDDDSSRRFAAATAIGRAAESGIEEVAQQAEALLLPALRHEAHRRVVDALASALLHVWARLDDESYELKLRLAADPSNNIRLAAVKFFALAVPDPMPTDVAKALMRLARDEDADIRWWAQDGLRTDSP